MKKDKKNPNHWIASNGKVFKRKEDGHVFGSELYLGYTYYMGGKKLKEPKLEAITDYVEIDDEKSELPEEGDK